MNQSIATPLASTLHQDSSEYYNESDTPQDWFVFVALCIDTVAIVATDLYLFCNRRRYPIKRKNVPLTIALSFFGLVWLWSTFVAREHLEMLYEFRLVVRCSVWDFWLQYLFGQTLWMTCVILRLHRFYRFYKDRPSKRISRALFVACVLPMLVVCSMVEFLQDTSESSQSQGDDDDYCETKTEWKVLVIACIAYQSLIFLVLVFMVRGLRNSTRTFNWYDEVPHFVRGALFAFILFVMGILISLGGYSEHVWGRLVLTCIVLLCTTYFFFSIVSRPIRTNCRVGSRYTFEFRDFMQSEDSRAFFIDWVRNHAQEDVRQHLNPVNIANAHRMLTEYNDNDTKHDKAANRSTEKAQFSANMLTIHNNFYELYVDPASPKSLPMELDVEELEDFRIEDAMAWILETLERHFWPLFQQDVENGTLAYFQRISGDPEADQITDNDRAILLQEIKHNQ